MQIKKENGIMKQIYPLTLLVATGGLLITGISLRANVMDGRIESTAKKSYVFKTCLKDDSIKTKARDGVVVLTGMVSEESHKALAENTLENMPGVMSVENHLKVKDEAPAEHSDAWIGWKVKSALLFH